jgi:mono/diheme cytochrome c family protein
MPSNFGQPAAKTALFKLATAGMFATGVLALAVASQPAFAQDALSGGARIFFEKGQCNQCHGKNGDGIGDDPREHGANLRESALDKDTMVMIISCGIPGTNMPYFEKFSYTDNRCYGMTGEQEGANKPQPPLTEFLAKRDIEAVADYIQQTFVGKGPVTPGSTTAGPATSPEPQH